MAETAYYNFRQDLYFYDLVNCFSVSLCGCPMVFDQEMDLRGLENMSLCFPGKHAEAKHMSPFLLRKAVSKGLLDKSKHIASCCMMLANTAYESVKKFNDGSAEFEFFRHIRNASSHLNTFQFNHKEPSHPAAWRGASIDHLKKGSDNPLFQKNCFGHYIGVADLIDLLMDIEKKIIAEHNL